MRLIKFVAFLLYRYYSEGRWGDEGIAFFRAKMAMSLLLYINLLPILIFFPDILPYNSFDRWEKRISILLIMLPLFILISLIVKKKHVLELKEKYEYRWDEVFNANVWLIVYAILSMTLLVTLAILNSK